MLILLRKIEEKLTFKVKLPKIKNDLKARKLLMLQHDPNSEISKAHEHSIDIHFFT